MSEKKRGTFFYSRCTKCKRRKKTATSFYTNLKTGYTNSWCNRCRYDRHNEQTKKFPERYRAYKQKYFAASPKDAIKCVLKNSRKRLLTEGHITYDQAIKIFNRQKGLCALSGIKLTWVNGTKRPLPTSISIDRKNPKKGYTSANIRFVCFAINSFRQAMSDAELVIFAKAIVKWAKR